jgi:hypothetical protein
MTPAEHDALVREHMAAKRRRRRYLLYLELLLAAAFIAVGMAIFLSDRPKHGFGLMGLGVLGLIGSLVQWFRDA